MFRHVYGVRKWSERILVRAEALVLLNCVSMPKWTCGRCALAKPSAIILLRKSATDVGKSLVKLCQSSWSKWQELVVILLDKSVTVSILIYLEEKKTSQEWLGTFKKQCFVVSLLGRL